MQLHTPYKEAVDTIIIVYLPMSAVVHAVITVNVHICGSSAPRTRPAPDSHMYTTAHALEQGKGGGLVQDRGGPAVCGISSELSRRVHLPRKCKADKISRNRTLPRAPSQGFPGGIGGGGLLHESSDLKPVQYCGHGDNTETR